MTVLTSGPRILSLTERFISVKRPRSLPNWNDCAPTSAALSGAALSGAAHTPLVSWPLRCPTGGARGRRASCRYRNATRATGGALARRSTSNAAQGGCGRRCGQGRRAWSCRSHSPPWSQMGQSSGWLIWRAQQHGVSRRADSHPARSLNAAGLLSLRHMCAGRRERGRAGRRARAAAHQHELHHALARLAHKRCLRLDHHIRRGRHRARRDRLGRLSNLRRGAACSPVRGLATLGPARASAAGLAGRRATARMSRPVARGRAAAARTSTRHMRQLPAMDSRWW